MNYIEEIVICVLLGSLLAWGAIVVIDTARDYAMVPCEAPAAGWEPPDLRLCPEDMALWDCIKDAAYRSDI